jgi:hypothetical protein
MSTFTPNKNIQEPANGSFNNDWDVPVNNNWSEIDTCFGGSTAISVTGLGAGSIALSIAQYQPPNIAFNGTISAPLAYVLPANVGGMWSIFNNTSGSFPLTFAVSGGGSLLLQQGQRSLVVCDGTNMQLADTAAASQAIVTAEAFATAADTVVTTNANAFASSAAATAQTNAENFAENGANILIGVISPAVLPAIGKLQGVIIEADPGGTPVGTAGQMYFFY